LMKGNPPTSSCANANWDAVWSASDDSLFNAHFQARHHMKRRLLFPNGGESFADGDTMHITWMRVCGVSARVTLGLLRDGSTDTTMIVSDRFDTASFAGKYNWVIPSTIESGNHYRVEVMHTAGVYRGDYRDIGKDKSDTTFTIQGAG